MGRSSLLFVFAIAAFIKMVFPEAIDTEATLSVQKTGTTIIYLVRHAEKVTSDPKNEDPELTPAGLKRAEDLKLYLRDEQIAAFFSTPYKRNKQTVAPIAQNRELEIYDAHDFKNLKARIMRDYSGQKVLVVGHSNTVLPIIEAFGGKKPVDQIADNQYDHLFKLIISPDGKAKVEALKYGARTI